MDFKNQKPISQIRQDEQISDKAKIAQLQADLAKERENKLTAMEAIAELYEMIIAM